VFGTRRNGSFASAFASARADNFATSRPHTAQRGLPDLYRHQRRSGGSSVHVSFLARDETAYRKPAGGVIADTACSVQQMMEAQKIRARARQRVTAAPLSVAAAEPV
jgi:hypothetical protein